MDDPTRDGVPEMSGAEAGRRRLLKALTVSAGAAAAAAIAPKSWVKPLVDAVDVPLHAQGTATVTISDLTFPTVLEHHPSSESLPNLTAQFKYSDVLGMISPSATHLWAALKDCQTDLISVSSWVPLSTAGMVVGNATSGTVRFAFGLPVSCWTAMAILLVQISAMGPGGTSRLSNTLQAQIPRAAD